MAIESHNIERDMTKPGWRRSWSANFATKTLRARAWIDLFVTKFYGVVTANLNLVTGILLEDGDGRLSVSSFSGFVMSLAGEITKPAEVVTGRGLVATEIQVKSPRIW